MARVCIMCEKETPGGHAVQDDAVIRAIRAAKQRLGMARNNVLVVDDGCMDAYRKRRAKYEKDMVFRIAIAAIILLVFVLLPVFTTGFSLTAALLGLLLAAVFAGLSLFSHCPRLAQEPAAGKAAKGKKRK